VFYRLRDLRPGDVVEVTAVDDGLARYSVERTEQVPKDEFPTFAVFGATPDDVLPPRDVRRGVRPGRAQLRGQPGGPRPSDVALISIRDADADHELQLAVQDDRSTRVEDVEARGLGTQHRRVEVAEHPRRAGADEPARVDLSAGVVEHHHPVGRAGGEAIGVEGDLDTPRVRDDGRRRRPPP